ncbi:MAG: rhomboid family intramembrane serine protease [Candidatus Kryptoniota bacterium]
MIPLKDRNPSYSIPYVNYLIIGINAIVFFYELSLGPQLDRFFMTYGLIPDRFFYLARHHELMLGRFVPFFTSMFIHGGWLHIIGNMWFLFIFGDNVEDELGHSKYLIFYILSGLAAATLQIYIDPGSSIPTIGASGAISGVLGSYIVLFPRARILTLIPIFFFFDIIELPAFLFIGIWFLMQFFSGIEALGIDTTGGVAWWAHVGGFIFGLFITPLFKMRSYDHY